MPYSLRAAESEAENVSNAFGIRAPEHIDLESIADVLGANVIIGPLSGAEARLTRFGENATIRVSDAITNRGRIRFSIAHELGHLCLNHYEESIKQCSASDMTNWSGNAQHEVQANVFAAELLMPRRLMPEFCEISPVNFDKVDVICDTFQVSRVAATIRFVRFQSESCAVVYSERGVTKWLFKSQDFHPFIETGVRLDQRTLAYDYFTYQKIWPEPTGVPANAWCDRSGFEIIENTFAIPYLNATLSLLWIES